MLALDNAAGEEANGLRLGDNPSQSFLTENPLGGGGWWGGEAAFIQIRFFLGGEFKSFSKRIYQIVLGLPMR